MTTSNPPGSTQQTFRGVLTAASPIHQGGTSDGNVAPVKRETVLSSDQQRIQIPVITGNGIRGALRRRSADMTLRLLDASGFTPAQLSAITSGGQISNTQKEWTPEQRVELSFACPHIGLFGVAGGKAMTPGQWQCGTAYPVASETAHITGIESTVPVRSISQIIEGVSIDGHGYHATTAAPAPAGFTFDGTLAVATGDEAPRASEQMIYSVEAIIAGTQFAWSVTVSSFFGADRWLAHVIRDWTANGGHVGGMSARGYGSTVLTGAIKCWADACPPPEPVDVERLHAALQIVL